jgi:hypothetical protein
VQATSTLPARVVFEDDFEAARAEAKRRHVPLFVDAWAP